jgi:hypothetical protein
MMRVRLRPAGEGKMRVRNVVTGLLLYPHASKSVLYLNLDVEATKRRAQQGMVFVPVNVTH